jgi:hypothetical protein
MVHSSTFIIASIALIVTPALAAPLPWLPEAKLEPAAPLPLLSQVQPELLSPDVYRAHFDTLHNPASQRPQHNAAAPLPLLPQVKPELPSPDVYRAHFDTLHNRPSQRGREPPAIGRPSGPPNPGSVRGRIESAQVPPPQQNVRPTGPLPLFPEAKPDPLRPDVYRPHFDAARNSPSEHSGSNIPAAIGRLPSSPNSSPVSNDSNESPAIGRSPSPRTSGLVRIRRPPGPSNPGPARVRQRIELAQASQHNAWPVAIRGAPWPPNSGPVGVGRRIELAQDPPSQHNAWPAAIRRAPWPPNSGPVGVGGGIEVQHNAWPPNSGLVRVGQRIDIAQVPPPQHNGSNEPPAGRPPNSGPVTRVTRRPDTTGIEFTPLPHPQYNEQPALGPLLARVGATGPRLETAGIPFTQLAPPQHNGSNEPPTLKQLFPSP